MILDPASGISLNRITNEHRHSRLQTFLIKKQKTRDSLFFIYQKSKLCDNSES